MATPIVSECEEIGSQIIFHIAEGNAFVDIIDANTFSIDYPLE